MTQPPFEILEHTADVGIKAYGNSLQELFVNAARGLISLASGFPEASSTQRFSLSACGEDYEELLVNWLSEILYYIDAEGWIFSDFKIHRLESEFLEGEALGERHAEAAHRLRTSVKAVTYHQISVRQTPNGWEAVVYFDI
ncbi:MAG: archease [Acidobacteria bacterium]|nr:archease [Acidobacteriota bacterium]